MPLGPRHPSWSPRSQSFSGTCPAVCAWPAWGSLVPVLVLALLLCMLGLRMFRKRAGEMVDEL